VPWFLRAYHSFEVCGEPYSEVFTGMTLSHREDRFRYEEIQKRMESSRFW
jgi:hypothetical protein